jgi:cyanophycinase
MNSVLFLIGGCEDRQDKKEILNEFVRLAGGREARIVTVTAPSCIPRKAGREYAEVFRSMGVKSHYVVHFSLRSQPERIEMVKELERATAIFLTGGDQVRGMGLLRIREVDEILARRFEEGVVVAGTSAGAAMIPAAMITGRESESLPRPRTVQLKPGLGLLKDLIVDTHFSQRCRFGRLAVAVTRKPRYLGAGVDEDTAIVIRDGSAEVLGQGTVTLIDARNIVYEDMKGGRREKPITVFGLSVHVVAAHHRINIEERGILKD